MGIIYVLRLGLCKTPSGTSSFMLEFNCPRQTGQGCIDSLLEFAAPRGVSDIRWRRYMDGNNELLSCLWVRKSPMTVNEDGKRADHIRAVDAKAKYLFEGARCLYIAHNDDQRAPGGHYQVGACDMARTEVAGARRMSKRWSRGFFPRWS